MKHYRVNWFSVLSVSPIRIGLALMVWGCATRPVDSLKCTDGNTLKPTTERSRDANTTWFCRHEVEQGGQSCVAWTPFADNYDCDCRNLAGHPEQPPTTCKDLVTPSGGNPQPSIPEGLRVTGTASPVTVSWNRSYRDKNTSQGHPNYYEIVISDGAINDKAFQEIINSGIPGRDHFVLNSTGSTTEQINIPVERGRYFVKVRAVNNNAGGKVQRSFLSQQVEFKVLSTVNVMLFPSQTPRGGTPRIKMTFPSSVTGDLSSIRIFVEGQECPKKKDEFDDRIFYFTPIPPPTGLSAMDVEIQGFPGGTLILEDAISVPNSVINSLKSIMDASEAMMAESFSFWKDQKLNSGMQGSEASIQLMDEVLKNQQYATYFLNQIIPASLSSNDKAVINGLFDGFETRTSDLLNGYVVDLGVPPETPPVVLAKTTAEFPPLMDTPGFFTSINQWMAENSVVQTDVAAYNRAVYGFAMRAGGFNMKTWVTNVPGSTIETAIQNNNDATVIINGALFNFIKKKDNHSEPGITMGIIMDNGGQVQNTSCDIVIPATRGCEEVAKYRWWMGETRVDHPAFVHGGRDVLPYTFGHPPTPPGPPDLYTAVGGLYGHITDKPARSRLSGETYTGRRILKPTEDMDMAFVYAPFSRSKLIGPKNVAQAHLSGFGGIVYDKETDIILVWAKPSGSADTPKYLIQKFFDAGADWAVGTDGGSSTALAFKLGPTNEGALFPVVKGSRHNTPIASQTVTNYIIFKKK